MRLYTYTLIRLYAHTLIRLFDWPLIRLINVRTQTSVQKCIQKSFFWVFTPTPRVPAGWKSRQWGWFFVSYFIELSRDSETLQNCVFGLFVVFSEGKSLQKCVPQPPTHLRISSKNVCHSRRPTYEFQIFKKSKNPIFSKISKNENFKVC